jgi:hypothetical protein
MVVVMTARGMIVCVWCALAGALQVLVFEKKLVELYFYPADRPSCLEVLLDTNHANHASHRLVHTNHTFPTSMIHQPCALPSCRYQTYMYMRPLYPKVRLNIFPKALSCLYLYVDKLTNLLRFAGVNGTGGI